MRETELLFDQCQKLILIRTRIKGTVDFSNKKEAVFWANRVSHVINYKILNLCNTQILWNNLEYKKTYKTKEIIILKQVKELKTPQNKKIIKN